eukprot:gene36341-biopygen2603
MLLDVFRKVWTTLVMGNITKVLLKHRVLRATQHAYLPLRGTDSANRQVVNTLETAFAEQRSLYGSSRDICKGFDSVRKGLIRLAWRHLGVTKPLANWLILLDLHNHTVVRTGHSFSCWLKDGLTGLAGLDFDAEMGCGQGDVSSPLTWVAVFDILLSVQKTTIPMAAFDSGKPAETNTLPQTCASRTTSNHSQPPLPNSNEKRNLSPDLMRSSWRPSWVPFKHEHCFKSLGVWYDTTASADGTQLAIITKELHIIIRHVHRACGSAASLSGVLRGAVIAKVAYYGGLSQWSLDDTTSALTPFSLGDTIGSPRT